MSDALKVVPKTDDVDTGTHNIQAVAEGLSDVLADTYRLVFKTHAYHWNVEGPMFYSVHNLTEDQYDNMFEAADDLAERIRALGQMAPHAMGDMMKKSVIEDRDALPSAGDMCEDLAADHERVAHRFHALIKLAGEADPVSEDLAVERAAFHEQAAWMLRALSKS
ncbi:MAG: DNA starvation/stationary phase protection protein [Pseudomonadota bacterium]